MPTLRNIAETEKLKKYGNIAKGIARESFSLPNSEREVVI